ncbi:MAG TPA: D-2-hydroxyacid dehydrogenase [Candidatus Methylacidiphilales bacterium]|nr:D-2-hydroxyacid dehydrogenase [Candidatus Methylacidiphilales bacterium]
MQPTIVVLDGYTLNPGDNPWTEVEQLGSLTVYDRTAPTDLLDRAKGADIILTNKAPLSREALNALPNLKFISVLATGYNIVDVKAAAERGIPVSNVPAYGTETVAQHVLALILELNNHVGSQGRSVAAGDWSRGTDFCYWNEPVRELRGLKLGIVGLGQIGFRVAELAHAFGMSICHSGSPKQERGFPLHRMTLQELFEQCDIITLHCPQTPENAGFVNAKLLSRMKPDATLINTARGTLINEQDLADALRNGTLAAAGLDVLSKEPPEATNPLLNCPHCLITPHVAWSGSAARRRLMATTSENIRAFLAGNPINQVNKPGPA